MAADLWSAPEADILSAGNNRRPRKCIDLPTAEHRSCKSTATRTTRAVEVRTLRYGGQATPDVSQCRNTGSGGVARRKF